MQLLGPTGLNAIGPSYQLLRAFRALLFLNPEDLQQYPGREEPGEGGGVQGPPRPQPQ